MNGALAALREVSLCSGWILRDSHRREAVWTSNMPFSSNKTTRAGVGNRSVIVPLTLPIHWAPTSLEQKWLIAEASSLVIWRKRPLLNVFFLSNYFTLISNSWCAAPASQFSQNKDYREVGDTAAAWPRYDVAISEVILQDPQIKLAATCHCQCKILFNHLAASAGPGLPNLFILVRA